jgi:hypothetical protein
VNEHQDDASIKVFSTPVFVAYYRRDFQTADVLVYMERFGGGLRQVM